MSRGGQSDDDYEEDFQDNAQDDADEMERIRNAMAREKQKADKFKEKQIQREKVEQDKHRF